MDSPKSLARVKPGDTVVLVNIFGRRLAKVSEVSQDGFWVGRTRFQFDGRGDGHCHFIATHPHQDDALPSPRKLAKPKVDLLQLIEKHLRSA